MYISGLKPDNSDNVVRTALKLALHIFSINKDFSHDHPFMIKIKVLVLNPETQNNNLDRQLNIMPAP